MLWLVLVILSYFIYALGTLGDKYILKQQITNPRVYAFYTGFLGILAVVFIPFGFYLPSLKVVILSLATGIIFVISSLQYYTALRKFEASRLIPAFGGLLPLFTFGLLYIFFPEGEKLSTIHIFAFLLLILGSVIVTAENKLGDRKSLPSAILLAFLFAVTLVLTKTVYNSFDSFFAAFIWMRIGGFLMALCLLLRIDVRNEIFQKRVTFKKSTATIFFAVQGFISIGFIIQSWAIKLVPLFYLPIINALQGTEYIFLLVLTAILAFKKPRLFEEKFSRKVLFYKLLAVLVIGLGLVMIALK